MTTFTVVDRIAAETGLSREQATEALAAIFAAYIGRSDFHRKFTDTQAGPGPGMPPGPHPTPREASEWVNSIAKTSRISATDASSVLLIMASAMMELSLGAQIGARPPR